MEWLNYHHLLYFWVVAREGSIARACELLELAQPTISHQIHELEENLGQKLFARIGRNIQLTDTGRIVYDYANQIFSLGRELLSTVKGMPQDRPRSLLIGVVEHLPKILVYRLLENTFDMPESVRVVCQEDKFERLLTQLALHHLDVILSDVPAQPIVKVRAFNHLLGECGISFFAAPKLAERYRHDFPRCLNGAPLLLFTGETALRRSLDEWFDSQKLHPVTRGEFSDSALLKIFGEAGTGLFVMPSAVEREVAKRCAVEVIGRVPEVRARCYAISSERRLRDPAWEAITEHARTHVYAECSREQSPELVAP